MDWQKRMWMLCCHSIVINELREKEEVREREKNENENQGSVCFWIYYNSSMCVVFAPIIYEMLKCPQKNFKYSNSIFSYFCMLLFLLFLLFLFHLSLFLPTCLWLFHLLTLLSHTLFFTFFFFLSSFSCFYFLLFQLRSVSSTTWLVQILIACINVYIISTNKYSMWCTLCVRRMYVLLLLSDSRNWMWL